MLKIKTTAYNESNISIPGAVFQAQDIVFETCEQTPNAKRAQRSFTTYVGKLFCTSAHAHALNQGC